MHACMHAYTSIIYIYVSVYMLIHIDIHASIGTRFAGVLGQESSLYHGPSLTLKAFMGHARLESQSRS